MNERRHQPTLGQAVEKTRERLVGLRDAPDEDTRREVASTFEL